MIEIKIGVDADFDEGDSIQGREDRNMNMLKWHERKALIIVSAGPPKQGPGKTWVAGSLIKAESKEPDNIKAPS